ncbi:type II secretion system F family protein [Sphingobacterium sp. SGR-19]|uniref:type II secretion system F family protein n=1 Tax=Sphingobacterium sp. SGR-19 TaxID=2710886 RepID=UPI00293BB87F|nr:type II secretion system F family protein [Sphingobacterium sp. SGR-19]
MYPEEQSLFLLLLCCNSTVYTVGGTDDGLLPYPAIHAANRTSHCTGQSLHESLSSFDFYPPKIIQLIRVGEEVNRLEFFFEKIANQLTEEVEYKTSTISTVLEPLIIIFLGLVVGLILIAMYLPMFQMSNSF